MRCVIRNILAMKVFYLFIFLKIPSGLLEGKKNSSRLFFHHQLYGMTRQRGAPWRSRPEKQTPEDVEEDEDDENELQIESEATEESSLFTRSGGVSRLGEDERHEVRPWGAKTRVSGLVYQGSKKWLHVLGLPLFKVLFFLGVLIHKYVWHSTRQSHQLHPKD